MLHRTQFVFVCLALVGLTAAAPAAPAQDLAERLAPCAACHGKKGRSSNDIYFPAIAGKPAGYLHSQLLNFREGRRQNAIMESLVAFLSDEYLAEMAAYYARQEPSWTPRPSSWPEGDLDRGRQLVEEGDPKLDLPSCRSCHGESLKGVAPNIPSLLGVLPEYLSAQLGAWRAGTRRAEAPDCMATIAQRLAPRDIGAVTAWIASRPYPEDHSPEPSLQHELPMACGSVQ